MIHESALSNGYRGDAWIKTRYGYRQDYSALAELGVGLPADATLEPIIEHVTADSVFPETSIGNVKKFKAVDIASVEWVVSAKKDTPYLNVERHLPGYIVYERYRLSTYEGGVDTKYGYPVQLFTIVEQVATGRESDVEVTEIPTLLVHHIPYKSTDDAWQGRGTIEEIETLLMAINDRLAQIDYVLWKHTDPATYGPKLGEGSAVRTSGTYIEVTKDDATPGYMTWNSELNGAFKELETLIAMVFQVAETPQWLFGTVLGSDNAGGTGTSHTDGAAIKARFLPILSKVNRIKTHYDRAIRDALYICQLLDIAHGGVEFEAVYPTITWRDGLPENKKEQAEIMAIRTGNKPTLDVQTAIKRSDGLDDMQAQEIIERISGDTEREVGTVDSTIFNEVGDEGADA